VSTSNLSLSAVDLTYIGVARPELDRVEPGKVYGNAALDVIVRVGRVATAANGYVVDIGLVERLDGIRHVVGRLRLEDAGRLNVRNVLGVIRLEAGTELCILGVVELLSEPGLGEYLALQSASQ
jgi:hypothetical protein